MFSTKWILASFLILSALEQPGAEEKGKGSKWSFDSDKAEGPATGIQPG